MRRCGIEDLVLGQPTPTTSASVQRQLCGKVTYSRFRPEAVAGDRQLREHLAETTRAEPHGSRVSGRSDNAQWYKTSLWFHAHKLERQLPAFSEPISSP